MKKKFLLREDTLTDFIITLPGLFLYTLLFMVPVVMGFFYSLTDWNGISKKFNIVGFANYAALMKDTRFAGTVRFTVYYTVLLIIGVVVI